MALWTQPEAVSFFGVLTAGEEVIPRELTTTANLAFTSGDVRFSFFTAKQTETTTQVRVQSGVTGAAGTTLARMGLYEIAADGSGTLVASTANDITLFSAAGSYTRSWSTPYLKVVGRRYALGIIVIATTTPIFLGQLTSTNFRTELSLDRRLTGRIASLSDLPASFTDSNFSVTGDNRIYGVILP